MKRFQTKYLLIVFIGLMISGCCGFFHNKETFKIKDSDKAWFPYKTKTNYIYETSNGLKDSLSVLQIDSAIRESGTECVERDEYRFCKLQSNKYNDFQIQISLDHISLDFQISYADKLINTYYCTSCSRPSDNPHEALMIDSINFNKTTYKNVILLSDSLNSAEIYYNQLGVIRYIVQKDTFDLK